MTAPTRRATLCGVPMAGLLSVLTGTRGAAAASARPAFAGAAATPISRLNQQLHALTVRRGSMDAALLDFPESPARDLLEQDFDANLTECLTLPGQILALPAATLEDAAIQAAAAYYLVDWLGPVKFMTEDEFEAHIEDMQRALTSILLVIAKAIDLNIGDIMQGDMDYLCERWWPGGDA